MIAGLSTMCFDIDRLENQVVANKYFADRHGYGWAKGG